MPGKFMNNPRYQRALKRMRRLGPNQKAILNTDELLQAIEGEESKRQLQYMSLGESKASRLQRKELGEASLSQRGRHFDKGMDLKKDYLDWEKDKADTAETLGYGNIAMGGWAGWMDLKEKEALGGQLRGLASQYRRSMMS